MHLVSLLSDFGVQPLRDDFELYSVCSFINNIQFQNCSAVISLVYIRAIHIKISFKNSES